MSIPSGVRHSVLDLAPIVQGGTAAQSFRNSVDLARRSEQWGYHRYWVAEHHNIPGVASAATAVLIGHIAGATKTIRVGAGGIMLPNHTPLVIAEQFGTLELLHPGRIDLGLGRAPGSDGPTSRAVNPQAAANSDRFPEEVRELMRYFEPARTDRPVRAIPGQGLAVPLYILGSSTFGARLAAELGLPYAYASHFAPRHLHAALDLYRSHFKPSSALSRPYAMIGANLFAADDEAEAHRLFTSLQQLFLHLIRGHPREVAPPVDHLDWSAEEEAYIRQMTQCSLVGGPDSVRKQLAALLEETGADEVILTAQIFDHQARLRSFELGASLFSEGSPTLQKRKVASLAS